MTEQNYFTFKSLLVKEAHLLTLLKSDCDLFLIAQANTITYHQLESARLHGATGASGRLSLKRLEQDGYIISKTIPMSRTKYYFLTGKGKIRVKKIFSEAFIQQQEIVLERRPPSSQFQLPHRIHTNDVYFAYLSCPTMQQLPKWNIEVGFPLTHQPQKEQLPRCDGQLITPYHTYYVEQDNGTQGDTAIESKLNQYTKSNLFIGKQAKENILLFTLHTTPKEKLIRKPPFSVYRLLLKATKIWETLEAQLNRHFSLSEFCAQVKENASPCLSLLTATDIEIIENLSYQNPHSSLDDILDLKKNYLYDTSVLETQKEEQDTLFQKRLRQKFFRILNHQTNYATLIYRLRNGMHFYVVPNHRLALYLPYLLTKEYNMPERYMQFLFHFGLLNLEGWHYHSFFEFQDEQEKTFTFASVFVSQQYSIIFEDICHDIGGRERVQHYLKTHTKAHSILFLLLVPQEFQKEDACSFLSQNEKALKRKENEGVSICFLKKTKLFLENPAAYEAYYSKTEENIVPAALDYDDFSGELHLIERQVSEL